MNPALDYKNITCNLHNKLSVCFFSFSEVAFSAILSKHRETQHTALEYSEIDNCFKLVSMNFHVGPKALGLSFVLLLRKAKVNSYRHARCQDSHIRLCGIFT